MLYEVISQPCISVFQFHIKNGFILVKYKIKSSKLHSLLHLTLSLFSPDTLSLSESMTISVHGTLLWTL